MAVTFVESVSIQISAKKIKRDISTSRNLSFEWIVVDDFSGEITEKSGRIVIVRRSDARIVDIGLSPFPGC